MGVKIRKEVLWKNVFSPRQVLYWYITFYIVGEKYEENE